MRKKIKRAEPLRFIGRQVTSTLLELLDSRVRPGVTDDEFQRLFARCECGLISTKRAFRDHSCTKEVIDLTSAAGDTDSAGEY